MNKWIDFSFNGGLPVTQDTFKFMQESYRNAFAAMAGIIGNKTIVAGMEVNGGNINSGWISYNGELIPFTGGPLADGNFIVIADTSADAIFEDNLIHTVYFTRSARLGSGGAFAYSELKRPGTFREQWQAGDIKMVHCDAAYVTTNFDGTGIGINERVGWALCNGLNNTLNMGGHLPIGYNPTDPQFSQLKQAFGNRRITLTKNNLPAVQLDVPIPTTATSTGQEGTGKLTTGNQGPEPSAGPTLKTALLGSGEQIDILPQVRVTLYIQKLP